MSERERVARLLHTHDPDHNDEAWEWLVSRDSYFAMADAVLADRAVARALALHCSACPYTGGCTPDPGGFCEAGLVRAPVRGEVTPPGEAVSEPSAVQAALGAWRGRHPAALPFNEWDDLLATVTALVEAAVSQEQARCGQLAQDHEAPDVAVAIRQAPHP